MPLLLWVSATQSLSSHCGGLAGCLPGFPKQNHPGFPVSAVIQARGVVRVRRLSVLLESYCWHVFVLSKKRTLLLLTGATCAHCRTSVCLDR